MPGFEPPGVWHKGDAVLDVLADRDRDRLPAGQDGSADTTGVLVGLPEAGTEVPGGDVMGGPVRLDVLEGGDPSRPADDAPRASRRSSMSPAISRSSSSGSLVHVRKPGGSVGLAWLRFNPPPRVRWSAAPRLASRPDSASRRRSGRMHGRWPRAEARSRRSAPPRYDTRAHWPYDRVDDGLTEPAGPGPERQEDLMEAAPNVSWLTRRLAGRSTGSTTASCSACTTATATARSTPDPDVRRAEIGWPPRYIKVTWQYSKATYGDAFGSDPPLLHPPCRAARRRPRGLYVSPSTTTTTSATAGWRAGGTATPWPASCPLMR